MTISKLIGERWTLKNLLNLLKGRFTEEFALGELTHFDSRNLFTIQNRNGNTYLDFCTDNGAELHKLCAGASYYEKIKAFEPEIGKDLFGNLIIYFNQTHNLFLKLYESGSLYIYFDKD